MAVIASDAGFDPIRRRDWCGNPAICPTLYPKLKEMAGTVNRLLFLTEARADFGKPKPIDSQRREGHAGALPSVVSCPIQTHRFSVKRCFKRKS